MIKMTGHKTLTNMVDVAVNRGFSKRGNWLVEYSENTKASQDTIKTIIGTYRIYHWGTLILEVEEHKTKNKWYKDQYINKVYGESVSDARGINAVLEHLGIYTRRYTFKPVNGGFQEVTK